MPCQLDMLILSKFGNYTHAGIADYKIMKDNQEKADEKGNPHNF